MIASPSLRALFLGTFLLSQLACLFPLPISLKGPPKTWEREFYRLPPEERTLRFDEYSVEEKIDLYLYGMTRMHPRVSSLARPLIKQHNKREIVPIITDRLRSVETTASEEAALSRLAWDMTTSGIDLRQEHALLEALEAAAEALKDHDPGRWITKDLRVIRAGPDGWRDLEP